jgi:hypothetical protein
MRFSRILRNRTFGGRSAAALLAAPLLVSALGATTANASVLISIDKSAQEMVVSVDGARKYTWPVSSGRSGYSTPSGKFTPFRMEKDHFSKEWDDAPMPNSIFFTMKGHAIHGTLDARHLGSAASHGCVRISTAHAETLFALVKEEGMANTKVVIEGSEHNAPLVAKRKRAAPDESYVARAPQYGAPQNIEPDVQYGQQQYGRARVVQPQYQSETDAYGNAQRDAYGRVVVRPQQTVRQRYPNGYIVRGDGSTDAIPQGYAQPAPQYFRRPYTYD